jgi:hypothetical protein
MKYLFVKETKRFYHSLREAERELGTTIAKIAKEPDAIFLSQEEVEEAIFRYISSRGAANGKTKSPIGNRKKVETT